MNDSLRSYYASRRAPAIVNCNDSDREIGRVFAEYKDRLLVIGGENKKHSDQIHFVICNSCRWCATYFGINVTLKSPIACHGCSYIIPN